VSVGSHWCWPPGTPAGGSTRTRSRSACGTGGGGGGREGGGAPSASLPHIPSLPFPSHHSTPPPHTGGPKSAHLVVDLVDVLVDGCAGRVLRVSDAAPPPLPPRGMRAARAEASRQRPSWRGQLTAVVEAAVHPVEKRVLQQHPEQQLARQHARAGQRAGAGIDPAPHREDDGPDLQAPPTPPPRRR
jgi:hypothetical protein